MSAVSSPGTEFERVLRNFAARKIPVLARTVEALARIKANEDTAHPRDIARAVLRDPMLTLQLVRYLMTHRSQRKLEDITTVEHAIMMIGMRQFFAAFEVMSTVEDTLKDQPEALTGVLHAIGRARTAAVYAHTLAALRADPSGDEVVAAALLHNMAEILLWCFDPQRASAIARQLAASPGLRSNQAQQDVLGYRLRDLQLALIEHWGLPELYLSLMDDARAANPRVQNVAVSVALARHTWSGWSNAALPSDLEAIGRLLGLAAASGVRAYIHATLIAIGERAWYGEALTRRVPLPGLPPPGPAPADEPEVAARARIYDTAARWLSNIAKGLPLPGHPRQGLVRDVRHDTLAAVTAFLEGISAGLGYGCALLLAPGGAHEETTVRFVAGDAAGAAYLEVEPAAAAAVAHAMASRNAVVHAGSLEEGRPRGLFAWPVAAGEDVAAVVVAIGPTEASLLGPDSFERFKKLGADFDAVLSALDVKPFWGDAR